MYQLILNKTAEKYLATLPQKFADTIALKIHSLKENPRPYGVKKLSGAQNHYRIRVGDYRVIYSIYENILTIEVVRIGHRKDVYR